MNNINLSKLIGKPFIEETKKGSRITQDVELGGQKRTLSFEVNKKIEFDEAVNLCEEKFKELSISFEIKQNEILSSRKVVDLNPKEENFISINLAKENILDYDSKNFCLDYDSTNLIETKIDPLLVEDQNKAIYNLMLDKLFIKEYKDYIGSTRDQSTAVMVNGLKQLEKMLSEEKETSTTKKMLALSEHLKLSFEKLISISQYDHDKVIDQVLQDIQNLEIGKSLLAPCGIKHHSTTMLFTRTGKNTFEITLYNTGDGVRNHYRLSDQSDKYQTFDKMIDVPLKSINAANLLSMMKITLHGTESKTLYDCFRNELGKGGTRAPSSPNEEDYESIQVTGSCGVQVLMAFLRHQAMLKYGGTPPEKLAFYKFFKAKMLISYFYENKNKIDQTISQYSTTVLKKILTENEIQTILFKEETFEEGVMEIVNLLTECGDSDHSAIMKKLSNAKSQFFSRYLIFRLLSTRLSLAWLKDPLKIPSKNKYKYLKYAFAKFYHYLSINKNYDYQLSLCKNFEESYDLLFSMLKKPFLQHNAIQKIVDLCLDQKRVAAKVFLEFKRSREVYQPFVQKIIEELEKQSVDRALYFKEFWLS